MTTFTKNCLMPFGKYKNKLIADIADIDPEYLLWANNKVDWFKIESDLYASLLLRTLNNSSIEEDDFHNK